MRNKKCLLLNRIGIFLSMIMLEGLMIRHDYLLASESLSYNEINLIKNNKEKAYEKLDESYREKRFGSLDNFKKYIKG